MKKRYYMRPVYHVPGVSEWLENQRTAYLTATFGTAAFGIVVLFMHFTGWI